MADRMHGVIFFRVKVHFFKIMGEANYKINFWSSNTYNWRHLKRIFDCSENNVNLMSPAKIKNSLLSKERLLKDISIRSPSIIGDTIDDSWMLRSFQKTMDAPTVKSTVDIFHNFNTHWPFKGIKHDFQYKKNPETFSEVVGRFWGHIKNSKKFHIEEIKTSYKSALDYNDQFLFTLLSDLKARSSLRKKTLLFVLTSDHGTLLGEHDEILHANRSPPYEEILRVPFVIGYLGPASKNQMKNLSKIKNKYVSVNDELF